MQRRMMLAVFCLCLSTAVRAAETTVVRYVEFRDGSVLRLPVVDEERQITVLRPEGRLETLRVRVSELQRLTLMPQRLFDKKRKLLALVEQLGDDEFSERERAEAELVKQGASVRADLELALELFSDVEIQYRGKRILGRWPAPAKPEARPAVPFDLITTHETMWGDAGRDGIAVRIGGATRRFGRRDVRGVSVRAPEQFDFAGHLPGPRGLRRIADKDFPRGCVEEGFETTPEGRKLQVGENIERLFLSKGFVLSTSITTSFVSVNNFLVNGKSGGLSVATHQPLYHGEITIRFVQPGREDVPAAVNYFGCWMAVVMPNGTSLVAYDFQDREIGSIHTEQGPHEFMGMYSAVPMHKIRVVPNLQIDPDYTLDDFIYSAPQTADLAHPEKYTAYFADGERVLCQDISFSRKGIRLHGLTAGLADRSRPLADLIRVTAPEKGRRNRQPPAGVFAELTDGSVIFGTRRGNKSAAWEFARRPQVLKEQRELVALWKTDFPRIGWPARVPQPVVWDAVKKSWQKVSDVALTQEAVQWTPAAGKRRTVPYARVAAVLLRDSPAERKGETWHLRTVQGEDLVLDSAEPVKLDGRLSRELHAVWHGKALKIPPEELVSVFRVPKGP